MVKKADFSPSFSQDAIFSFSEEGCVSLSFNNFSVGWFVNGRENRLNGKTLKYFYRRALTWVGKLRSIKE